MYTAVWTVAIYNKAVYAVGECVCVLVFSTFVGSQNHEHTHSVGFDNIEGTKIHTVIY